MSASAPTATSPRTASRPRRTAPTFWEVDRASRAHRIFASGLRNPNGLSFEPQSDALWTVVNERDELGPDLVPDYMTSVKDGAFYGWPYSYYGQHVDPARAAAAAGSGRQGDPAGLRAELARRAARAGLQHRQRSARKPIAAAPSSASTAAGTGRSSTATRWSSCPSPTASPTASRRTS